MTDFHEPVVYATPGELEQARKDAAAIEAVRQLHSPHHYDYANFCWTTGDARPARTLCRTCVGIDWPCPTSVAALGGDPEPEPVGFCVCGPDGPKRDCGNPEHRSAARVVLGDPE